LHTTIDDGSVVRAVGTPLAAAQLATIGAIGFTGSRNGARMSPQSVVRQVERLEERVTVLEQLPARLDALTLQVSQLRSEMHAEFSAVRSEMRTGNEALAETLRAEIKSSEEQTRSQMRMLHEEVIARLALLQEGQSRPRKRT
jgi:hypothetical protein